MIGSENACGVPKMRQATCASWAIANEIIEQGNGGSLYIVVQDADSCDSMFIHPSRRVWLTGDLTNNNAE